MAATIVMFIVGTKLVKQLIGIGEPVFFILVSRFVLVVLII